MPLVCIFKGYMTNGLWNDLKTVNGYLRRLSSITNVDEIHIFLESGSNINYKAVYSDRERKLFHYGKKEFLDFPHEWKTVERIYKQEGGYSLG